MCDPRLIQPGRKRTLRACCALVAVLAAVGAAPAHAGTGTFTTTAAGETAFKVPAGVTSVAITAVGQEGGTGNFSGVGGAGAQAAGSLDVNGAQMLYLEVAIGGGHEGDNFGAGKGGGSSELRLCSVTLVGDCNVTGPATTSLDSRLLVAAGGGGGGESRPGSGDTAGGVGGAGGVIGTNNGDGADGQTRDAAGGHGGTGGGGAGGAGSTPDRNGGAGDRSQGGAGGAGAGGGGGSGFYGGGGGGGVSAFSLRAGGGGGGMSFARSIDLPNALADTTISGATGQAAAGSPSVQLTYTDNTAPSGLTLNPMPGHTGGRPTFSGTAGIDTGDSGTVAVTLNPSGGGPARILTTTHDAQGNWSVTPSTPLPSDSNYAVTAAQSDNASNTSTTSVASLDVDSAVPTVTLDQPGIGASLKTSPTFSGAAGNKAKDLPDVTVSVYAGSSASGAPVRTLHATPSGASYSVPAGSQLADGTYTAVASQSDNGQGTATSDPHTFTVDTGPPTVQIDAPLDGATLQQGSQHTAGYSCADAGGTGVVSCTGTVVSGAPVDTGTIGVHALSVTAADRAGNLTTRTVHYRVIPASSSLAASRLAVTGVRALGASRGCPRRITKLVKAKTARSCTLRVVVSGTIDARAAGAQLTLRATAGRRHVSRTLKLKHRTWSITLRLPSSVRSWRVTASFAGNRTLKAGSSSRTLTVTTKR